MGSLISKRLEIRLAAIVGVGLLAFSVVAGFFTYRHSYREQLEQADALQRQLVRTVQAQAEVGAYAANAEIVNGVLDGLLANPTIAAARIESSNGFVVEAGSRSGVDASVGRSYPLFSPVNSGERIGGVVIVQNDAHVARAAARVAVFHTALMLAQVLIAAAILAAVLRVFMVNPIARLAKAMVTIAPGSSARLAVEAAHADDEIGLLAKSANAILDAAETAIEKVSVQRNELERLATHDHLTGLLTQRIAEDHLHLACAGAQRSRTKVALLFIDLDGFKAINDAHGHEIGDGVLREVAKRLGENVRAEDTVARIGGDEFLIILGNLPDAEDAARVATNIGNAFAAPVEVSGATVSVGASIGIAIYPDHTGNVDAMRRIADQAMYQVKRSGKGSFAFLD